MIEADVEQKVEAKSLSHADSLPRHELFSKEMEDRRPEMAATGVERHELGGGWVKWGDGTAGGELVADGVKVWNEYCGKE